MPLKKNDIVRLAVSGTTAEGQGVGRTEEGRVLFIPGAAEGDLLDVRILKVTKTVAYGKIEKIIAPSPARVEPDCSAFPKCGGCVFRHIRYEEELRIKHQRVADAFRKIGGMEAPLLPIVGAQTPYGYRNKAQFPVGKNGEELLIGFFAPHSHRIIPCQSCALQPPLFETVLGLVEEHILTYHISVYNEERHEGLLRHIYLRYAAGTGELMVCLVLNGDSLPQADALISRLREEVPQLKSFVINSNTEKTNVVLGKACHTLYGSDTITDTLCGLSIEISPLSFYQVNRAQTERLYRLAADCAALTGRETVLDLYCGAGTIGLSMAGRAKQVIGVEIVPEAVENAKRNAARNGIHNARFLCSDASGAASLLAGQNITPDVVILDPPRKGCAPELLETVAARMKPQRIVYVSCDPATLARDCARLLPLGYAVKEATPVDMFPRTSHVECVVSIQKRHM